MNDVVKDSPLAAAAVYSRVTFKRCRAAVMGDGGLETVIEAGRERRERCVGRPVGILHV